MKTILLQDPVFPGVHQFLVPDEYYDQFQVEVLPGLLQLFNQASYETNFDNVPAQFEFAWGAVIGAAISAASAWLKSRGGSSSYWSQWNWEQFVEAMKQQGCVTDNPKFAYVHHCDGNTYRVWINNSGFVEYAVREKTGTNCRVNSSLLPQQVLDQMPACSDGSRPLHNPGTGTTTTSNLPTAPLGTSWGNIALIVGFGVVVILVLKKAMK